MQQLLSLSNINLLYATSDQLLVVTIWLKVERYFFALLMRYSPAQYHSQALLPSQMLWWKHKRL